jgi:excisionase family DNA binding protein
MAEMLNAKEMKELLQVDRSTIYRMAETGRLPAVKVGKQWRFPGDLVDSWLKTQTLTLLPPTQPQNSGTTKSDLADLLPHECVQLIQNTFADALGVMLVITDMDGQPITEVSHPCGLFKVISQNPHALQNCIAGWRELGQALDLEPKFSPSHLGLLCARSMIRVGMELKGMVIVGGIAPDNWPPAPEAVRTIAAEFGVSPEALIPHLTEVFYLDEAERGKVLSFMQRIANIVAHIINERQTFMAKLETIASLTR